MVAGADIPAAEHHVAGSLGQRAEIHRRAGVEHGRAQILAIGCDPFKRPCHIQPPGNRLLGRQIRCREAAAGAGILQALRPEYRRFAPGRFDVAAGAAAGIEQPPRPQTVSGFGVDRAALGLAQHRLAPREAQPAQILQHGRFEGRATSRGVDILDPKQHRRTQPLGHRPDLFRRQHVPKVQPPGRRGREAGQALKGWVRCRQGHGSSLCRLTGHRQSTTPLTRAGRCVRSLLSPGPIHLARELPLSEPRFCYAAPT